MKTYDRTDRHAALEANLCDTAFADRVAMVLSRTGVDSYRAAAPDGSVDFRHGPDGTTVIASTGIDPLADGDDTRFLGIDDELASTFPTPAQEATPHAHDEIAQFFDSPHAPDLAIVHTARHRFHGNAGEHGSLGTVQRRAPFVAAGPGVETRGWIDGCARTADVAPTVAALAGVKHRTGVGRFGERSDAVLLGRQDGQVLESVVSGVAKHTLIVLWDGVNANEFAAAIGDGDAPNASSLVDRGTALRGGMLASFPSATLANHTTIGTGAMPGHSGVLHNEWFNRDTSTAHNLLDPMQMFEACTHLSPGVETLHEAVHRTYPDAFTATTYEFCDRGAEISSFRQMAAKERLPYARSNDVFARDEQWWNDSIRYQGYSRIDETATRCALALWADDAPIPKFAFCNFSLTDEAGHEGGPHSPEIRAAIRDSDERLGRILRAIERRGVLDDTAIVLVADHGMQQTDESLTSPLTEAFAGHDVRDVDGFVYL